MLGYTEKLYILPFDHRASFAKDILGNKEKISGQERKILVDYKEIIWEGFSLVWSKTQAKDKDKLGIFAEEEFGAKIMKKAKDKGVIWALAVEKSGQAEFDFEHGPNFGKFILAARPSLVKALVRYNPQGDKIVNGRQLKKLKILNDWCKKNSFRLVMELLVPREFKGEIKKKDHVFFEINVRPKLILKTVKEFHLAGIEPDIWKIEAMERLVSWDGIIKEIRKSESRAQVGVIMLGRGASKEKIKHWIKNCPKDKVNGFAVGRTIWQKAIIDCHKGKINREQAVSKIGNNYSGLIKLWERG